MEILEFKGNWNMGNTINFAAFVNGTNRPDIDKITPCENPQDKIKIGDLFYMYWAREESCYTLLVIAESECEVLVQYVNNTLNENFGKREWVPRIHFIRERYDYEGRAILTKNIYKRLDYEHALYEYRQIEHRSFSSSLWGEEEIPPLPKYVELKQVPIPTVKYRKFPEIRVWV